MRRLTLLTSAALVSAAVSACGGGASAGSRSHNTSTAAGSATSAQASRGSATDRAQITQLIKAYGKRPSQLCTTYATPAMLAQQFGSKSACLKAAAQPGAPDPGVQVTSIVVTGRHAVATRVSTSPKGYKTNIVLIKIGASWKVQASLPSPS